MRLIGICESLTFIFPALLFFFILGDFAVWFLLYIISLQCVQGV
jgi:hypothetical protein